jgi:hypothetical protein
MQKAAKSPIFPIPNMPAALDIFPTKPASGQKIGFFLLAVGATLFVFVGCSFERTSPVSMRDFNVIYSGARCLVQKCDPYAPAELERAYMSGGGGHPSEVLKSRRTVTVFMYPPTELLLTSPLALFNWGVAHLLWMIATAASLIIAAFLVWDFASNQAPIISACLIGFFLLTSELLLEVGNIAGITISLSVIAVWCFLRHRFAAFGVLCLAVSLLIKPQDAGLVWLYLLLAGRLNRKRALQTLVVVFVLALPSFLWISRVAPNWIDELHVNVLVHSAHGADSDPGPDGLAPTSHGAQLVSLQTVFSLFWDDPRFYNPASYLVSGVLLITWLIQVLRSRPTPSNTWFALAAVSALSMLPTYHRQQDTRLLLLPIPAFAVLWSERSPIRWLALIVTAGGVFFTGDMPLQLLAIFASHLGSSTATVSGRIIMLLLARPAPLALFTVGAFYLYIYMRRRVTVAENDILSCRNRSFEE